MPAGPWLRRFPQGDFQGIWAHCRGLCLFFRPHAEAMLPNPTTW
jgi:hypothetical protein